MSKTIKEVKVTQSPVYLTFRAIQMVYSDVAVYDMSYQDVFTYGSIHKAGIDADKRSVENWAHEAIKSGVKANIFLLLSITPKDKELQKNLPLFEGQEYIMRLCMAVRANTGKITGVQVASQTVTGGYAQPRGWCVAPVSGTLRTDRTALTEVAHKYTALVQSIRGTGADITQVLEDYAEFTKFLNKYL